MIVYTKNDFLESPDFPFYIALYAHPPDWNNPHMHEFIECVYVAGGTGEHLYKGNTYPISRGDFFVIEPNTMHGYRVLGGSPLRVYNILFLPSLLESELRQLARVTPFINFFYVEPFLREPSGFQYHLKLSANEGVETEFLLDRIAGEYRRKALGYRLLIKSLLMDLFVSLSRCYEKHSTPSSFSSRNEQTVMLRVCDFIRKHYAQPIMMEQIYQMCGMSASTFTTKFKQVVGKTFIEFRNEVRIGVSRELLRNTDDKIIHIAREVGFEDVSQFNKVFKQLTGTTPGQYRAISSPGVLKSVKGSGRTR